MLVDDRLYVECWGDPAAPAVLYLHGGPGQGCFEFVEHQAAHLSQRLRLIAMDQRGVLRSRALPEDTNLGLDDLVADCETVRRHLGIDSWAVLGQSFGGMLALRYADAYAEAVNGVVFENPCWDVECTATSVLTELRDGILSRSRPDVAERARAALAKHADARELWASLLSLLIDMGPDRDFVYVRDDAVRERIRALLAASPFTEEQWARGGTQLSLVTRDPHFYESHLPSLGRLSQPALLLKGALDPIPSAVEVAEFRRVFGTEAVVEFGGVGHFVQAEAPERYAELVTRFVTGLQS